MTAREPFSWPVRVYYEDTDAGGVVYYANYLKFLQRARTSAIGFPLSALEREHNALFVVHRLEIDYRQPARLGDLLAVTFALAERGRSRLIALQDVLRGELLLVRARVTLACLDRRTWRPARIPAQLAARINDRVIEEIA